jgi:hypothetical protein
VASTYTVDVRYNALPLGDESTVAGVVIGPQLNPPVDNWTCDLSISGPEAPLVVGESGANVTVSMLDSFGNRYWAGGDGTAAVHQVRRE